ncbi:cysteine dioxygenase [Capsaspora owczarzaki ATCC 30864]|uniref:Cysteine dioxygenase n=1 Tax=Capsaspora owczarzaki (strain ATCC 30864) TaxID=595528 RepID=A0A0D2U2C6_CAPO3|nr:cysteine dioxygenase [Capsaspora owczarzaki ATCC 30864]KJE89371.1 cysteine dioxygenase [Capsaspora owczarzaki ATCC 30864]|eukprot:XP_004365726.1 cysteine dioxygenase [Capsaspora owczarzaki ATCC 30864]
MDSTLSLEVMIQKLDVLMSQETVSVAAVNKLLESYDASRGDWQRYGQTFDAVRYTRTRVWGNKNYNLLVLAWDQGQGSAIHDHENSVCFMKILDGALTETRFSWAKSTGNEDDQEIRVVGSRTLQRNGVAFITDQIGLHAMNNKSNSDKCVSLHLYSPPFEECGVFGADGQALPRSKLTFCKDHAVKSLVPSSTEIAESVKRGCVFDQAEFEALAAAQAVPPQ